MSCPTFKVSVGIPVFGLGFTKKNQLILGGGGGASRSGVKNKLVILTKMIQCTVDSSVYRFLIKLILDAKI